AQRDPAGLAEFQRAVRIAMDEHSLDRDRVGSMLEHQRTDGGMDALQTRDHLMMAHVDAAARHVALAPRVTVDDAKTGPQRAGVEPEYPSVATIELRSHGPGAAWVERAPGLPRVACHGFNPGRT